MKRVTSFRASLIGVLGIFLMSVDAAQAAEQKQEVSNISPYIVGGHDVRDDAYPFMVTLQGSADSALHGHRCGGSLIDQQTILTAAHCVVHLGSILPPERLSVIVGRTVLTNENQGMRMGISKIFVHPRYLDDQGYDVAVLRLKNKILGYGAIALAVPGSDVLEVPGTPLTVIGWGHTRHASPRGTDRLQEVEVPAVAYDECLAAYSDTELMSGNREVDLCAGSEGFDSCQKDSGGPLFKAVGDKRQLVQVGVVSRGRGCAAKGRPGIYVRLRSIEVHDFIRDPERFQSSLLN
ncbi:S1 family peptidase [Dyella koreensis]|uniref:Serine protease n=1 Tax=Dyella koreensis TaxID=311235 RepID=A0ABW8JZN1_9GAMM